MERARAAGARASSGTSMAGGRAARGTSWGEGGWQWQWQRGEKGGKEAWLGLVRVVVGQGRQALRVLVRDQRKLGVE